MDDAILICQGCTARDGGRPFRLSHLRKHETHRRTVCWIDRRDTSEEGAARWTRVLKRATDLPAESFSRERGRKLALAATVERLKLRELTSQFRAAALEAYNDRRRKSAIDKIGH
ncbi:MAG: hypothetical protein ACLQOO_33420 [Terriglobia bacterium]